MKMQNHFLIDGNPFDEFRKCVQSQQGEPFDFPMGCMCNCVVNQKFSQVRCGFDTENPRCQLVYSISTDPLHIQKVI